MIAALTQLIIYFKVGDVKNKDCIIVIILIYDIL